ncbi:subtilisin-like protease SBT1.6 [Physcomitrium patens]|uniref:Peptidase S8/S53 domain-containing protein n=1 Tax=Physcomitrium patens TaxID=3218 RepID=A0A2K1K3D0_PHYPA|nr:hypothetical protein PHYPA_012754 [Physcomitrium patens]
MGKMPGVKGLYPDLPVQLATTRSTEFLGLASASGRLWADGKSGEDVIIGVIDSGIWPERLSFDDLSLGPIPARWNGVCEVGTNFTVSNCNRKIIGARFIFAGREADKGRPIEDGVEDYKSPRDMIGHGTHCASTAAGMRVARAVSPTGLAGGTAAGTAPKARIAVYKALWGPEGRGSLADLVKAIDWAVTDGVDVISYSVGGVTGEYFTQYYPMNVAMYNAVKQGIFFSVAAGNDGSAPGTVSHVAPWVTTVAATTQDRDIDTNVELGDGTVLKGRSDYDGTALAGQVPLVLGGDIAVSALYVDNATFCGRDAIDASKALGKIVLCFKDDVERNQEIPAGAVGLILAMTVGENLSVSHLNIPYTNVGNKAGKTMVSYIGSTAAPTATIHGAKTVLGVKPAPKVAGFSNRGPITFPQAQWLKPDIGAPGVDILAAGIENEDWAFMTGTSMACPQVSGIGALIKASHPTWSPAAIKSAMMTSASIVDNTGNIITRDESGETGTFFDFGAGLVRPESANDPGLIYDMGTTDYLNFLCALQYTPEEIQHYEPNGHACPTAARVEDVNLPSMVAAFTRSTLPGASVTFNRVVTNVGAPDSVYTANIIAPAYFEVAVEPATITFSAAAPTQSFTLTVSPNTTAPVPAGVAAEHGVVQWKDGVHVVQSPIVAIVSAS